MIKIAYHLPQFHTTPENDQFWGDGFTEWTNLKKAKPLFRGHNIKHPSSSIGYYNLLSEESLKVQAQSAAAAGLDGFCFWHYDFGENQRTLYQVPELFRKLNISFPYMLAWVNCDWTGAWIGRDDQVIFKQQFDLKSIESAAEYFVNAFTEPRYLRLLDSPLIQVVYPDKPELAVFYDCLDKKCEEAGLKPPTYILPAIHLRVGDVGNYLGDRRDRIRIIGWPPGDTLAGVSFYRFKSKLRDWSLLRGPLRIDAEKYYSAQAQHEYRMLENNNNYVPTILAGWDNTPRYGRRGVVIEETTKSLSHYFGSMSSLLRECGSDLVFFKAWNEWAEGNFLEPDCDSGQQRLEMLAVFK